MLDRLEGCTAIITGASGGLGSHISEALGQASVNLVLAGLSAPALTELAARVSRNARVVTLVTDVGYRPDLQKLVDVAKKEFDDPKILVNNAGIEMFGTYHKLGIEDIERIINVNLTGAMVLTRMLIPGMIQSGGGHIINISSLSAKAPPPFAEPYAATKAGLIAFTESLRLEYREAGISASVIVPGFVQAGIYQRLVAMTGLPAPKIVGTSPPEAVAYAVMRALKKNIPEIIVNPGPTRFLSTIAELSPLFAEWVMRRSGIVDWFTTVARVRERKASEQYALTKRKTSNQ